MGERLLRRARIPARALAAAVVGALFLTQSPAEPGLAKAKKKPKPYVASGSTLAIGLVTHDEFIFSCPELPASQGFDAYVVEVPVEVGRYNSTATITGSSTGLTGSWYLGFYSYGCAQGDLYVEPPTTVPRGTGFIVVQQLQDVAGSFELRLTPQP